MTVLITGGTGFQGSRIAKRLVDRGEQPVIFDLYPADWRIQTIRDKVKLVRGDITNLHQLMHAAKDNGVTSVIHLGFLVGGQAEADPVLAAHVNATGTTTVFELGRLLDLDRILFASSITVYGSDEEYPRDQLPLTEDSAKLLDRELTPVYTAGKLYGELMGEYYRKKYGVFVAGIRPSLVYGYGRESGLRDYVNRLILNPAMGLPIKVPVGGENDTSMIYVEDIIDEWMGILDAPKNKFKHYFYNSGGDKATLFQIATAVKKFIPDAKIEMQPGRMKGSLGAADISSEAIAKEIGVTRKHSPLEKGVEAMIAEVRARAS